MPGMLIKVLKINLILTFLILVTKYTTSLTHYSLKCYRISSNGELIAKQYNVIRKDAAKRMPPI